MTRGWISVVNGIHVEVLHLFEMLRSSCPSVLLLERLMFDSLAGICCEPNNGSRT
jgi:hypothetical protein